MGRGGDARIYQNSDGAQTGANRAFHANLSQGPKHKVEPGVFSEAGATSSQVGDGETLGVTNYSQHAEHAGQQKVIKDREDATANLDTSGNSGEPVRDSVKQDGDLPGKKAERAETLEISDLRAIREQ